MAELRYNPINNEWIMIASHRQARPNMPAGYCPFCPGSGAVPDGGYMTLRYSNDYPALSQNPPVPDDVASGLFEVRPAYGVCEVLLYSDDHTATVGGLSDAHTHKLAKMWRECFDEIAADENVKYVYIFENRGDVVGVTMPHPHGQVYGYSYIPKKLAEESASASAYLARTGRNLYMDLLAEEKADGRRVLFANEHFTVYMPFFSPVAYGIHVTANRHVPHIGGMTACELDALGETVRDCAGMYDSLFGEAFPYMMCMHNAPVNSGDCDDFWQFHIEFFPPMRSRDRQQFFASSETGAGAWCNPTSPEEKSAELRVAYLRYTEIKSRDEY